MIAWVGQTGTQNPHPVQADSRMAGRLFPSMLMASQLQAILQLVQITSFQAMHASRERTARPTGVGGPAGSGPATGQTLKQSPQNVQPAAAKER
jgi:hypothetical protein